MEPLHVDAVRIFVDELATAHAFYAGRLGLALRAGGPAAGYCVYEVGAVQLVVEPVAADAPADDRALVGRFSGVSFRVADAQAAFAALQGRGVPFDEPPQRQPWGGVLATFADPAGNRLQLVQPPAAG